MLKLTIITINRNNAIGLRKTIQSVINQNTSVYEYIVIDGASADDSVEIIKEHAEKISYWVSEPDTGIYNAMNKGIIKSTGEYLLFLNSGDELKNTEVIETITKCTNDTDFIIGKVNMVDNNGKMNIHTHTLPLRFSNFFQFSIPHQATLIKKTAFDTVGLYNENYKIVSDWYFFLMAIFKFNLTVSTVDIIISNFYQDGISSLNTSKENIDKNISERYKILKQEFPNFYEDYIDYSEKKEHFYQKRFQYLAKIQHYTFARYMASILLKILTYIKF